MFFTFYKLYKWYQIAQNITYSSKPYHLICFFSLRERFLLLSEENIYFLKFIIVKTVFRLWFHTGEWPSGIPSSSWINTKFILNSKVPDLNPTVFSNVASAWFMGIEWLCACILVRGPELAFWMLSNCS